jgi:hypothetical protein
MYVKLKGLIVYIMYLAEVFHIPGCEVGKVAGANHVTRMKFKNRI